MPNRDPKKRKTNVGEPKSMGSMGTSQRIIDRGPITHSETFADHFSMILARLKLRLPPGWFTLLRERKDQSKLTATEQERFLCAFSTLNGTGALGQMVQVHSQMHNQHGTLRFLPWHRIFLYLFENELASIHPDVTLPYWDWTQAGEQTFPAWLAGFTPTVTTPSGNISVTRSPGTSAHLANFASNTPATMALTDFGNFSLNGSGATWPLEGIHDVIHGWVGGTMGVIATAPADPIFWMHHANIDRLWWQWQKSPQGSGKNPPLTGGPGTSTSPVMDPWTYTEADTRDITGLGYTYV
jgi:tyrosinase